MISLEIISLVVNPERMTRTKTDGFSLESLIFNFFHESNIIHLYVGLNCGLQNIFSSLLNYCMSQGGDYYLLVEKGTCGGGIFPGLSRWFLNVIMFPCNTYKNVEDTEMKWDSL